MTMRLLETRVGGFDAVVLENRVVRAVVIPELGGRVWELIDRRRDRQWIWHRPDVPLERAAAGASYDDLWAGGWEELFPNDAAGCFEGRELPDHGEWWMAAWHVTKADGSSGLRLETTTSVRRTQCMKEFVVDGNELRVSYRIRSLEAELFHCLFKQHFAVSLNPFCRLELPGGRGTVVDPSFGTLAGGAKPFAWPTAVRPDGTIVDLTVVPPQHSAAREFVYVDALPSGWCGVHDAEAGVRLRMQFDSAQLPFVWLFLAYGGWRNCYTAVLEPCTNMPKDLAAAVRNRQSLALSPGGIFTTRVTVRLDTTQP